MLDQINLFCHQLLNPSNEKVKDMSLWFNYLSYDIMGEMVFGRGFGMLTDPSLRYILELIDATVFSYLLVCFALYSSSDTRILTQFRRVASYLGYIGQGS